MIHNYAIVKLAEHHVAFETKKVLVQEDGGFIQAMLTCF